MSVELYPRSFQWARYWLPYEFRKIEVPGKSNVYLPLNRQYKPIGIAPSMPHVEYEDFAASHAIQFGCNPARFKGVWWGKTDCGFWLYDDSLKSRQSYFARLAILCQKKMKVLASVRSPDA